MSSIPHIISGITPESVFDPQTSAFGEQSVSEITPIVQVQFPYNINERLIETRANNGSSSINNNMLKVATGAAANQSAAALTRSTVKYNPGQGGLVRFTSLYTTGVANSSQVHGIGSESDGFFFGFDGSTFGVLRRSGGSPKIIQLIVTTKATSAGNVTITLDGDDTVVAVTDATATDLTTTANEIAAGDYSDTGTGWRASVSGDTVTFISFDAAIHGSTYTFTDTDTTGAAVAAGITNVVTGVAPTDTWIAQSSWNHDTMDGNGDSGMTFDPTKLNVFQIRYQWLGSGRISFYIEDDVGAGGKLILVHEIHYTNANTITSIQNPTLPLHIEVINTSNTSDISMHSGSMAGFIEGKEDGSGVRHGATATAAIFTQNVEKPVLTIRNKLVYQGEENRSSLKLQFIGLSQDSTKTSTVKYTFNATLTGASFSDVSPNTSTAEVDSTATAISGGLVAFAEGIGREATSQFSLEGRVKLLPGESLTISIIPNTNNPDVTAAQNWIDDF